MQNPCMPLNKMAIKMNRAKLESTKILGSSTIQSFAQIGDTIWTLLLAKGHTDMTELGLIGAFRFF
jgi:hypothetical protein